MKYMQSVIRCDGTVVMLQKKGEEEEESSSAWIKKNGAYDLDSQLSGWAGEWEVGRGRDEIRLARLDGG